MKLNSSNRAFVQKVGTAKHGQYNLERFYRRHVMRNLVHFLGLFFIPLLALAGCHELGHMDGTGGYGTIGGDLVGEVRHVDTREREIDIRTEAGRSWTVRYDRNTRVTYRQRDYEVSNLEAGDFVAMRTTQDGRGRLYTDLVTVRESVQDRGGYGQRGRLDQFEGTVEYIDERRGRFEVRDRRNRLVVVTLPYNAPRSVNDRFERLRRGDYVRVEGRFLTEDRFELESFV
jgi:hypothetical protein